MCSFLFGKKKKVTVTFYDDVTTTPDICVIAASRLQRGHGDIVSDVLWRNSLCTERGWDEIVMEQESKAESEGDDIILA